VTPTSSTLARVLSFRAELGLPLKATAGLHQAVRSESHGFVNLLLAAALAHAGGSVMTDTAHDATLRSWVESANENGTDFPIQNLPFGVFRKATGDDPRVGIAVGDQILDVRACLDAELLEDAAKQAAKLASGTSLNSLMQRGRGPASSLRQGVSRLLQDGTDEGTKAARARSRILVPMSDAEPLTLPSGETRSFIDDGDEIILRGDCERDGYRRIGFGECRARVLPARSLS